MNDRITVRMSPAMLTAIDQCIAKQAQLVSRQEVVRRCVAIALLHNPPELIFGPARDNEATGNQVVYLDN